jgi:mono/diheme cytochrome c family protein
MTKKPEGNAKTKDVKAPASSADSGQLRFTQDIAPILVANCVGCHSPGQPGLRRGKLDLTTFEKLQKGTPKHPQVIVPGKPAESHLVLRIRGEETPRMPQGANRALSDLAIGKIEQWVKSGAQLEAGIDPKATLRSYAASPEQMRQRELAKLPISQRDKLAEAEGLKRWKQSNAKVMPEITTGDHFIIFSNLPKDRATSTLKALETQFGHLRRLLGAPIMDWAEKVSYYVFSRNEEFIEFLRSVEGPDADSSVSFSAKLAIPQPYIALADPSGGKKDDPSARRRTKTKRGAERDGAGSDRSLLGLMTESLGAAVVGAAGNAPRWLREGVGTYMAAQVEPRSPYYRGLRTLAFQNFDQGWQTKASETLGGAEQISAEDLHAVSFALVEAMLSTDFRNDFPTFLHGMLEGQAKLDDMLQNVYGGNREQFLTITGEWVATHYGRVQ